MQKVKKVEEDWKNVEVVIKQSWQEQNNNPSLDWNDVKQVAYYGWCKAKEMDRPVQSIH